MIEKTFNQLKEDIINSKNFYWYEYGYTTWETKAIIWKIVNILWTIFNESFIYTISLIYH